ncbi:MAG: hypothetical protein AAGE52_29435 [Myxococcota bacterium]
MADDSTIENRVYLFKDLAAAWIAANPGVLQSAKADALAALAELARVSAEVADPDLDPATLAKRIRGA